MGEVAKLPNSKLVVVATVILYRIGLWCHSIHITRPQPPPPPLTVTVRALINSFIHSFIHSFTHSFIHSFIQQFVVRLLLLACCRHRRSQDFVWVHFFPSKVGLIILIETLSAHSKNALIDSCSTWDCTWCAMGALTNFPRKIRLNFFSPPWGCRCTHCTPWLRLWPAHSTVSGKSTPSWIRMYLDDAWMLLSMIHRRSQDFVWGCTFLKLTTFF